MGIVVRSPASRKIERDDCKCFILEKDNYLCFRKNFTGALSDEQERKYCSERSFKSEKQGGLAKESDSPESQNILRTIKLFTKGVRSAVKEYEDSGKRDIPYWRNVVGNEVEKVYLHPGPKHQHVEMQEVEKRQSSAPEREKVTKSEPKSSVVPRFSPEAQRKYDEAEAKRRAHEAKRASTSTEEPDERVFVTPETIRALNEQYQKKIGPRDRAAIESIAAPLSEDKSDRVERVASLLDYRYHRFED